MGIGGKRMSAADYRAARRAGTIGASAVGSQSGDAAQRYCRVSESALLLMLCISMHRSKFSSHRVCVFEHFGVHVWASQYCASSQA